MKKFIGVALVLMVAWVGHSTVLTEDHFAVDGPLVGTTPAIGGVWANHSGGSPVLTVAGGSVLVDLTTPGSEDANSPFVALAAGKLYVGAKIVVVGPTNPTGNEYFFHFRTGFTFRTRIMVSPPVAGGDFTMAMGADSSTPGAVMTTDLNFGQSYLIVASYDFATGDAQLWIDPAVEGDPSITDITGTASTAIDSVALRQQTGTNNILVDDVVVATTFAEVISTVPVELQSFSIE